MKKTRIFLSTWLVALLVLATFVSLPSIVDAKQNSIGQELHEEVAQTQTSLFDTSNTSQIIDDLLNWSMTTNGEHNQISPCNIFPGDGDPDPTPGDGEGDEGGEGDEYDPNDPEGEGHQAVTRDENGNVSSWVDQDGVLHVNNTDEDGNVPVDSNGDPEYSEATGDERVASWGRILDSIDEGNTTIENNTGMPLSIAMKTGDDEYSGYTCDSEGVSGVTFRGVPASTLVGEGLAGNLDNLEIGGSVCRNFSGILIDEDGNITYIWSFQANKENGDLIWGTSTFFNPPDIIIIATIEEDGSITLQMILVVPPEDGGDDGEG